ncbi:MAG: leucine-rich repeat domain-containing protein, partial [Clostridia bacterium]|nr:leucine-rich repeat domain-containing protein [Clostridia bacterium]
TELVIPQTHNDGTNGEADVKYISIEDGEYGRTSIFLGTTLKGITLPNTIINIPEACFQTCMNLESVTLPKTLTNIEKVAFYRCTALKNINLSKCSSLTSIGDDAFYECEGLTSISLSSSLTSIGEDAFRFCSGLTSVDLSKCTSLTSIGIQAFQSCSGLTSITIPASVTKIGQYAFQNSGLTSMTFEDTSTWYRTSSSDYTNGTETDVTNATQNATWFKSTSGYYNRYWYKL